MLYLMTYNVFCRGNGWYEHIYEEHNVYDYLAFLIYLEKKNITDCNGIEKYVKERMNDKDPQFFPIHRSKVLEELPQASNTTDN